MTLRVASGRATRWIHLARILLAREPGGPAEAFDVETCRAYGGRLVVKLRGIDDASAAEGLRGRWVLVPPDEVPALPAGEYYASRLLGLAVVEDEGASIGRVADVLETEAGAILVVERGGGEAMIPLAREFVREVNEEEGTVRVRLPEGLLEVYER